MVYLNLSSLARVPGSWFKKSCDPDPSRIEKLINLHVDTTCNYLYWYAICVRSYLNLVCA